MAEYAKENLFFFAKAILGYKDMTKRVHEDFCEHLTSIKSRWKIALMPRGHFKSTINMSDCIRRLAVDPEERVLLVSESGDNAEDMLGEIKGHFTDNPLLQAIFPHIIPKDLNKATWTRNRIVVPRRDTYREGSIDSAGVKTKLTSRHYTLIKADDLIAEEAMESPSVMRKSRKFANRLVSLLVNPKEDEVHVIGTRWAYDDIYQHMIDSGIYDVFVRKAIVLNKEGQPEPFFPQRWSMKDFQNIIETDPNQWATNFANDPRDTSVVDFRTEWLRYFNITPDKAVRWKSDDGRLHMMPLSWMTFYIHVDPSVGETPTSDYSGIVVVGLTPAEQVMVVDAVSMRLDPVKLVEKILRLNSAYQPRKISVESNAYQKSILYWLQKEARRRGEYVPVEEFRAPSNKQKPARIRGALQPLFANGQVWIRERLTNLIDEYIQFGKTDDDHLMDALAQGPEFWRFPQHPQVTERRRKVAEEARVPRGVTGYGL